MAGQTKQPDWLDNIIASVKQFGGSIFQPSPPSNPDYEKYPTDTEWYQQWHKSPPEGWYDKYGKPSMDTKATDFQRGTSGWLRTMSPTGKK